MAFTVYRAGEEIQVNTTVEGDQLRSSITTLNDGGWIVAWSASDAEGSGIFMQRFNAQGARVEGELQVNTSTSRDQYPPVTVALEGGGWVVAWQSMADYRIHLRQYDQDGLPAGEFSLAASEPISPGYDNISIAGLPGGGWVVTWPSSTGTTHDIMQQRFNSTGGLVGSAAVVNSPTNTRENYSSVTALKGPAGGWVVAWSSAIANDASSDILLQRFDADGGKIGGEIRVGSVDGVEQNRPRVAALADGGFVVTWHSATPDGHDVYQQRYGTDGSAGSIELVSQTTFGVQNEPSVTGLADGGWVVTFNSGADVYQRYYDSEGRTSGPDLVVPAWLGSTVNKLSTVSALPNGGWVVSWQNFRQDYGNTWGIAQRTFNPTGDNILGATAELAVGTDGDDTLRVESGGLVRDVITGNDGTDTLMMIGSGDLDLFSARSLSGVERLIGSTGNDVIISDAERLTDFTYINGGDGEDRLELFDAQNPYDLTGKTIEEIERIVLSDFDGKVLVDEVDMALLVHAMQDGNTLELTVGTFTFEQRLQLFRQGIDTIIAGGVTYRSGAPDIGKLNGDQVTGLAGQSVRLDRGGDAELNDAVGRFDTLTVMITNRNADEDALGIDVTNGSPVTLSNGLAVNSVVSVEGTAIGTITADGGAQGLTIAFNDTATADQVEALLHVLTYANTSTGSAVQRVRDITITLTNDGGNATTSNVTVDVKSSNAAPVLQLPAGPLSGFDTAQMSLFAGALVRDVDIGQTITVTVRLDDSAKGVLIAGKGGSYDATNGIFTYHGTAAGATEALAALQFDPRDRSDPIGTPETTTFTVTVDDGIATDTETLIVNIRTSNRAPAAPVFAGTSVNELSADGKVVGTLSVSDPNGGDALTFSLLDAPQGLFAIRGHELVVANGVGLDYEQATSHTFTIRATDAAGLFNDRVVTVNVGDVNPERTVGSSRDDRIVGGGAADMLSGGAGADILAGRLGKDTLRGDGGRDVFVFDTKPNKKTNVDKIADFSVKDDTIWLDNAVFKTIGKGTPENPVKMKAGFFYAGTVAHDRDDRIIYDKATGKLFYDEDGTGRKAQVEIAVLKKNLKMTAADFFVI